MPNSEKLSAPAKANSAPAAQQPRISPALPRSAAMKPVEPKIAVPTILEITSAVALNRPSCRSRPAFGIGMGFGIGKTRPGPVRVAVETCPFAIPILEENHLVGESGQPECAEVHRPVAGRHHRDRVLPQVLGLDLDRVSNRIVAARGGRPGGRIGLATAQRAGVRR